MVSKTMVVGCGTKDGRELTVKDAIQFKLNNWLPEPGVHVVAGGAHVTFVR